MEALELPANPALKGRYCPRCALGNRQVALAMDTRTDPEWSCYTCGYLDWGPTFKAVPLPPGQEHRDPRSSGVFL